MSALICRVKAGLMLLSAFTFSFTRAFNLDTHHPVIFRSPLGGGESLSYFGFAVALTQTSQTGQWVLVGAPRANSTLGLHDVRDTGALFRCSLATVKCEEVVVDPTGNARHTSAPPYYMDRKQGSWTGGTLTAVPREQGRVAVCGQLWSNQLGGKDYYANGVCYWMDSEVRDYNASKKVPLLDNTKQVLKRAQEEDIKMYGYGQAGTSAHFAKNGEELLLGAPGVYNWKGTVVRYSKVSYGNDGGSVLRRRRRRQAEDEIPLGSPEIAASYLTDDIQKNDYFGYSVSSGEFLGDEKTYYVAGAPRAAYGKGKVFVFEFPANGLDPIQMELERVGEQVGEYFGHSVLSADLSGDGWPELLVGAPLWGAAHGYEEGRVYVFPNVGGRRLGEEALILGGDRITGARFGFALANIGDLDLDGYQDLAVGAPYEDNGRGAIYIYLGGPSGVSSVYSQKILASQFSDGLRAFGISLSSGIDMDGNQYTDVAVGSYLSGDAVLLRSQPVLRFHADLRPNVDRLHVTDKQFSVTACLKYFGRHLVDSITADIQLRVESLQIRAVFRQDGVSQDSVRYSRSLDYDAYRCDDWTVDLESEVIDFTQPIVLSMYYNLTEPSSGGNDGPVRPVYISTDTTPRSRRQASSSALLSDFCSSCPVVNRRSAGQTHVTTIVPFSLGCGDDNVCNTDLKVAVSLSGLGADGRLVIGAAPILDLDVLVTNEGESASIPRLELSLPSPLRLVRIPQLCSELEQGDMVLLQCDLRPHPLINGGQASLQLKINTEQLVPGTEQLQLLFNVSSSGVELMADDNLLSYSLMLKTEADIAATGEPVADPMYYDKREDRDEAERNEPNYVKVQQRFRVERFLPSPVEAVNISFLVPVNMTDEKGAVVRFLDVFRPQATFNSRSVNCKISTGYYLAKDGDSYVEVGRAWSDKYRLSTEQLALLDKHSPVPSVPGNLGTHLSCTQSTVSCVRIQCPPVSFRSRQAAATVLLEMRVKLHELEPRVGKRDRIILSTVCLADVAPVPYPLQPATGRPDLVEVHTRLLPSSLQPFPVWIIVVTVIGSLLLLAAITYGLYKAGFFKRRRRPEDV